jgi:hypothetical protein
MPAAEGEVVVKDMEKEESDEDEEEGEPGGETGGGTSVGTDESGELGGDSVLETEPAKRPVKGFRAARVRRVARVLEDNKESDMVRRQGVSTTVGGT